MSENLSRDTRCTRWDRVEYRRVRKFGHVHYFRTNQTTLMLRMDPKNYQRFLSELKLGFLIRKIVCLHLEDCLRTALSAGSPSTWATVHHPSVEGTQWHFCVHHPWRRGCTVTGLRGDHCLYFYGGWRHRRKFSSQFLPLQQRHFFNAGICLPGADEQCPHRFMRRLDFPCNKRTKILSKNLWRFFGASEWFGSVSPSERDQTCVLFCIPHGLTECIGCLVTNFLTSIRSVWSNSAASAPDLVLTLQVAYDVGLRRFLYQNRPFRRDEDFSCW